MSELKDTVVLYHANCTDGFGSAFAAYKKFGEKASYIPVRYQEKLPDGLSGKDVFIVDFSYHESILKDLETRARRLVVLDHHKSAEAAVKSIAEHHFSNDHSGAYLSWKFFHPDKPVPNLVREVEAGDLFRSTNGTEDILMYVYVQGFHFHTWKKLLQDFEDPKKMKEFAREGKAYARYRDHLVGRILESAQEVEFEGYRVFAINGVHELREFLGNALSDKSGYFGIVWYQQFGHIDVSLRGCHNNKVDLSELAQRFGGGGHYGAAGFRLDVTASLPWSPVDGSPRKT